MISAMPCFASAAQEKPDKESRGGKGSQGAGIYFNTEASTKEVGLPIYPGARPHKEKDTDKMAFKAGTKEKQHVVGIEPNGSGSVFELVYVESPDTGKEK